MEANEVRRALKFNRISAFKNQTEEALGKSFDEDKWTQDYKNNGQIDDPIELTQCKMKIGLKIDWQNDLFTKN